MATDLLTAGHDALARGAWEEARACFEAARDGDTPEILEGLAIAAWWLNDGTTTFDVRNQAYLRYRERGDRRGAARMAIALAWDHYLFRGEDAVANGWVQRAHRLLEGIEPCAERALLAITEGHLALMVRSDPATARKLSAEAVALAESLGLTELEMLARARRVRARQ